MRRYEILRRLWPEQSHTSLFGNTHGLEILAQRLGGTVAPGGNTTLSDEVIEAEPWTNAPQRPFRAKSQSTGK